MSVEVKAPHYPESVADGTLMTWYKQEGEPVKRDEKLADIETDKVVLEVAAPEDGVLTNIHKQTGETVLDSELLATLSTEAAATTVPSQEPSPQAGAEPEREPEPEPERPAKEAPSPADAAEEGEAALSPAVRKLVTEHDLDSSEIRGTGKRGRITKEDVMAHIASSPEEAPPAPTHRTPSTAPTSAAAGRQEERVPMSRLRARIAERLVQVQQETAMLTTFNEVNMEPVMELRKRYKERFEKEHGVRLGFMSFFVKAAVEALKKFPAINASVDEKDVVYHNYYDISVAVSTERGLVVPVLRNADLLSFAQIEASIENFAQRAKENQLTLDELSGGTFTLTNGGVFGSLLSTPILNPPQSAILGMHRIQERPVAEDGQVVIHPMMYLALSYDHRIVDGRDAVQFLVAIRDALEEPARLLLQV